MITSIEIENLRGIRTGKLEGLGKLTILTGPNACGKSTVLDALLIACSPDPADAVGRAVARHGVAGGSRWLFPGSEERARLTARGRGERVWRCELRFMGHSSKDLQKALVARSIPPPYTMVHLSERVPESPVAQAGITAWTAFGSNNEYEIQQGGGKSLTAIPFLRLVDPGLGAPRRLDESFSEVARAGGRQQVYDLLAELVPEFQLLEILAVGGNNYEFAVTSGGRSVPLGLSGDGIQAFVQLALEIAVAPDGLVLVEEPEVYQHPRAIRQTAKALLANMRRGVQMVITTHSLELIDALLAEAEGDDLEGLVLFNLLLENGELKSGRRSGEDIVFARETLENDLR